MILPPKKAWPTASASLVEEQVSGQLVVHGDGQLGIVEMAVLGQESVRTGVDGRVQRPLRRREGLR